MYMKLIGILVVHISGKEPVSRILELKNDNNYRVIIQEICGPQLRCEAGLQSQAELTKKTTKEESTLVTGG